MSKRTDLPRIERDYYATWDPKAVAPIAKLLKHKRYVEPFVGSGDLIANLNAHEPTAFPVYASDVQPLPRVKGTPHETMLPFKQHDWKYQNWERIARLHGADMFLSNPPWLNTKDSDFQLNSIIMTLSSIRPTWLLLNANYAFNHRSSECMKNCVEMFTVGRIKWIPNSKHAATEDSAWFHFDANSSNGRGPILRPRETIYE